MRPNAVFSRFADRGRRGEPIVVHGSGRQWRQFTHASDIAVAVQLAVESDEEDLTLNITSDECVTIEQLATLVSSRYDVPVTFGPERHGDPPSVRISSAEAARVLGWRAGVPFQTGLSELLDLNDELSGRTQLQR
jgi:nucleoside-diphosphate-sugar epimerase